MEKKAYISESAWEHGKTSITLSVKPQSLNCACIFLPERWNTHRAILGLWHWSSRKQQQFWPYKENCNTH